VEVQKTSQFGIQQANSCAHVALQLPLNGCNALRKMPKAIRPRFGLLMNKSFRLSNLTPSELKLMHNLAEVIRAARIKGAQRVISVAAAIDQEIQQRGDGQKDIILSESADQAGSRRDLG
jgi:hypothetical protein